MVNSILLLHLNKEDDNVDMFFASLAAKVRKLSATQRSKLEIKFLNDLNNELYGGDSWKAE